MVKVRTRSMASSSAGETSQSDCLTCSQKGNISVRQDCGNAIGGRVWLDLCYLRYENYSFFGIVDTSVYLRLENTQKKPDTKVEDILKRLNVTHPNLFSDAIFNLLGNLTIQALAPAHKGFASGSDYYSSFGNIYGMVQCLEDLSTDNCSLCLSSAITAIYELTEQEGARTLLGSCTARYEIYDFLLSYGAHSPSLEGPPTLRGLTPPIATTTTSAGSHEKFSKTLPIILRAVGAGILASMVFAFAIRQKLKSFPSPKPHSPRQKEEVRENAPESLLQKEQTIFDLETLKTATGNFHNDNKLGEGGFGAVYKVRRQQLTW